METDQTRVLITGALHPTSVAALSENQSLKVTYRPDCQRSSLEKLIGDAQVLITRSETKVDKDLIDLATELKLIARAAVGVANIDIEYATTKGILVLNTPGKNTNSAAELTFALILSMLRKVPQAHSQIKMGGWDRHLFTGRELRSKKIGLIGLGNVGHRVAKFAHGFDMEVFGFDPYISPQKFSRFGVIPAHSLEDIAKKVDILSVHVPLNSETRGMITQDILELMPAGSFVVNAARGGIISEKGILNCLESGHLTGAAIDTWDNEPDVYEELSQHSRVICSPHIGASTEEAQKAIGESIVVQLEKALSGGVVDHPVNLPQIGVIDNPLVKPYAILAEKLGRMAGQLNTSNPSQIKALYRGDLADVDHSLIRLGWMKGFVSCAVNSYVSFVNAPSYFSELGLSLDEDQDPDFHSYRSAIKFVLTYENGDSLSIGGLVFDESYMRLSVINDFNFEVEPEGTFVLIENEDKPGVVGDVGSMLAREQINIDSFELSRKSQGGRAMALIRVDHPLASDTLEKMMALRHVRNVQQFRL